MINPLDTYIQPLINMRGNSHSFYVVRDSRDFVKSIFFYYPSLLKSKGISDTKAIVGNDFIVNYLSWSEEIIIEPKPLKDEIGNGSAL